LDVRFTVKCIFDVIFYAFERETHIQTAHPKR
jgi:hypothetical protein